ncbi:hypothetical protein QN277_010103 [Acacia crassicarpa]|uniref:FAD-binding PCMH-type domain-containing protein n=1 Tax=Acacia crassicarpa TaxID=499986 RepID=A0AAE1IPI3_9FABA|nr:hypothetical protein QN277_010103 [Acacia crassicarpa]
MKPPSSYVFLAFVLLISFGAASSSSSSHDNFLQCLHLHSPNATSFSKLVFTNTNFSYSSLLHFSIHNLRFSSHTTPKPLVIVTPLRPSHIQASIFCSQRHGLQIRTRSGGHDYEGLSYVSHHPPFILLDLINLNSVHVDQHSATAWLQSGATIGQLYYQIAQKSKTLAFPAGVCTTLGVGGHFSGGGYGFLMRKYGLSADNIIDAHIIDAKGRLLDRESMGEDLFWAIRGGGGASFGVIVAWKIRLVSLPPRVTVFRVARTLEQNATKLVHAWQSVGSKLDKDLFIRVILQRVNVNKKTTIKASFESMFLGSVEKLLPLMQEMFPELGLVREDCDEMSWIESILYFANFPIGSPLEVLLNRTDLNKSLFFKGKSDYVREPIPENGLEGIWRMFDEQEAELGLMILNPYGGRMDEIAENEIPFPHRFGNLYKIQHLVYWLQEGEEAEERHIDWIRRLYTYMEPFVSKSPRAAYLNYRDLDIGVNNNIGYTSYEQASIWGSKYFKNNFRRLAYVKTKVDPLNFFRNEQSIPSLIPSH